MKLSPSSYDAFWACPEKYRLSRLIQPAATAAPLRQGVAFHALLEASRNGWDATRLSAMLAGASTPSGETLSVTAAEAEDVSAWFQAWVDRFPPMQSVAVERWFEVPLLGGRHTLLGRLDTVVRSAEQTLWVHEIKTDSSPSEDKAQLEWPRRMQLRAEVAGARSLGFDVAGVVLDLIGKKGSHKIIRVPLRFTPAEVDAALFDMATTANLIEWLRAELPDGPWPHPGRVWPCSRIGACEFETVCGQAGCPEPDGMEWVAARHPSEESHVQVSTSQTDARDGEHAGLADSTLASPVARDFGASVCGTACRVG